MFAPQVRSGWLQQAALCSPHEAIRARAVLQECPSWSPVNQLHPGVKEAPTSKGGRTGQGTLPSHQGGCGSDGVAVLATARGDAQANHGCL